MPYQTINVVAFDADDTLWVNEPIYQRYEQRLVEMLSHYHGPAVARQRLFKINTDNIQLFGYGVKGFVLSMIETAIEVSDGKIGGEEIQQILDMGKQILQQPVELLTGVEQVLQQLQGEFQLMLITKGDLVDQQSKILRSGLANYFNHIEIVSEKDENSYQRLLSKHQLCKSEFLMVGNSLKSDVLPVVNIGGKAVHIPFHTTWQHEQVDAAQLTDKNFAELKHAQELLPLLLA